MAATMRPMKQPPPTPRPIKRPELEYSSVDDKLDGSSEAPGDELDGSSKTGPRVITL